MYFHKDEGLPSERLYFFQFPNPFPEFAPKENTDSKGKGVDRSAESGDGVKTVTFSEETKPPAPGVRQETQGDKAAEEKLDGIIGQLEVYQSGTVKMRLTNGMVLDVRSHVL